MPNWCHFDMIVAGRRENVDLFCQVLRNNYDKTHMFRIHDTEVDSVEDYGLYRRVRLNGDCAWSVYCCMLPGESTYFNDMIMEVSNPPHPRHDPYLYYEGPATNLLILSKQLELDIAIRSEESGMAFCELYHIKNGERLTDKVGEFNELYFGDGESWEELQELYGQWGASRFTKEEYDEAKARGEQTIIHQTFTDEHLMEIAPPAKPVFKEYQRLYKVVGEQK